ncbi:hypothetical protein PLICRDRAFT_104829 [Plicaturopsis crispa FD-325 SS-3]|nr:hypothetical protein PLICRDRAFT_104829 [Plicaturopsis crispa FD-325 SS-3]
MSDSFFAKNKPRKRKRSDAAGSSGPSKKFARKEAPNGKARGSTGAHKITKGAQKGKGKGKADEELESDATNEDLDDLDLRAGSEEAVSGDEDEDETPAEKRLRLAQLYLDSVKEGLGADGDYDAAEIDKELISARLKQDVMEHSGKVHLFVADSFDFSQPSPPVLRTRGHRFSVTSAVASADARFLFTAGKEGSIIKWDIPTGKKLATFHKRIPPSRPKSQGKGKNKASAPTEAEGHTDEVLALALSGDGKLLASGGRDRRVGVWDVEGEKWVRGFGGHKDLISTLAFRKNTNQLYTGSHDRTLKLYDLSPTVMGYVETLFGHQDAVLSLDALRGETAVSVGGRDKTVRFWKIVDESQLVFRGGGRSAVRDVLDGIGASRLDENEDAAGDAMDLDGERARPKERRGKAKKFVEGSIECVAMIDETTFVSGGDSGSICLWTTQKKKPVFTQALAHGLHEVHSETEGLIQTPRWVTAIASLRYSDTIASGSWEGDIRIWKLDAKLKSLTLIGTIPAPGVVNSLQFLSSSSAAVFPTFSWAPDDGADSARARAQRTQTLLVAGLGQEHRLGRWLKITDGGAVNGALVVALQQRTLV